MEVEVAFEPTRAFLGEDVWLRVWIRNGKRLPLPIVRVVARFPPGLLQEPSPDPTALRGHRRRMSIAGRTDVTLRLPVVTTERGEFWLEGVEIELSDPFDLTPVGQEVFPDRPLLVMPEPRVLVPLTLRRRLPFGRPAPAARLFEDREHFAGVRTYEPGDPMHHVHWKLTAHAGELLTKRYEPTRSAEVLFAVDVAHGEPFWYAVDPPTAEETIGWTSFLARQAIAAGWRIGLVANTHLKRGRGPLRVRASSARGHEAALFAALARMPNQPTNDLGPVLREVGRHLPGRTTIVVVSPRPGPALQHEMEVLRRKGSEVVLLSPPGREWPEPESVR
ncbi:MAG TPA: DUF58 domain-containing protein [Actinomycetota bacterium]